MDADESAARICDIVSRIPAGSVASYGQIARLAGLPGRARLVGRVLRTTDTAGLPWHRVVTAQGRIALPEGSDARQLQCQRLQAEGVTVRHGRVDLERHGWQTQSAAPLLD